MAELLSAPQELASERGIDMERVESIADGLSDGEMAGLAGVDGWLRVDLGIDPADGASRLSAAWVQG